MGRPNKYNWDEIYKEFLKSGLTKKEFCKIHGISPTNKEVRFWKVQTLEARLAIEKELKKRSEGEPQQLIDLIASVKQWALGLAPKHYRASQTLRLHAEIYLEEHFKKDETGVITGTKLHPRELNRLANVLAICQKMERLACGLSTENVLIPDTAGAEKGKHVGGEGEQTALPKRGPVFVVEVNQSGKFLRPRPRLALNPSELVLEAESSGVMGTAMQDANRNPEYKEKEAAHESAG